MRVIKDPNVGVDGNYIGVYLEGEGTGLLEVSRKEFDRIYAAQNSPRYKKIAVIKEAASQGSDMSPGDPVAILAMDVIEGYIGEIDGLHRQIRSMYENLT